MLRAEFYCKAKQKLTDIYILANRLKKIVKEAEINTTFEQIDKPINDEEERFLINLQAVLDEMYNETNAAGACHGRIKQD